MTTATELKPCPFCGATKAKAVTVMNAHSVFCRSCDAFGPTDSENEGAAIAAWNRRAALDAATEAPEQPEDLEATVAALRAIPGSEWNAMENPHEELRKLSRDEAATEAQPVLSALKKLHVGDSNFEGWFADYLQGSKGLKQVARDAYAAGMEDPLVASVLAAPTVKPSLTAHCGDADCDECEPTTANSAAVRFDGADERQAFEAWLAERFSAFGLYLKTNADGSYQNHEIRRLWDTWQASALLARSHDQREGWISVEERLPDERGTYIVFRPAAHLPPACDPNVIVKDYHGDGVFSGAHKVTHWMPLPAAPKTSGGEKE